MTAEITYTELVELLDYDHVTGIFTWRKSPHRRIKVGAVAGTLRKDGRVAIALKGTRYLAHRLAWLHCMQEWPSEMIDHINGNPTDNSIDNLREATGTENQRNRNKQSNNKAGYKGVSLNKAKNKYVAQIKLNGKQKHIGYFDTPELAYEAYEAAAKQHFKEFKREDPFQRRYTYKIGTEKCANPLGA